MCECPPVLIGEKVWWLGSGSGLPKKGVVRWIGRLAEIGPEWALGIELEESLPYGGVDGTWRGRQLFKCKPKHGLIVPSDRVVSKAGVCRAVEDVSRSTNKVVPPPRAKRESLLLDRHPDFRSVHLEAVRVRKERKSTSKDQGVRDVREMIVRRQETTVDVASRKEKTNSGLFSFLRWFKREKEERSLPSSPVLRRSESYLRGSVDTLFSTATAASFAFVPPEVYRPFGTACPPEKWIYPEPETDTYRERVRKRDLDFRPLREKYNLYASGSLGRSLDCISFNEELFEALRPPTDSCSSTLARKKRKAPEPPNSPNSESLPSAFNKETHTDPKVHRRTVSESAKYRRKSFHVKGKRKAPPPPVNRISLKELDLQQNSLRKKRKAPPPPFQLPHTNETASIVNIVKEAALDIISEDQLLSKQHTVSSTSVHTFSEVTSTDTLRLEKGILKPNKMESHYSEPTFTPTSPVSPRPWYKRNHPEFPKHNDIVKKKDSDKSSLEDWMLESGFPRRPNGLNSDSKFNIFSRIDRPEDKRRSQISILTNISELDREAAEIIKRGKERESAFLASKNAKYYQDSSIVETNGQKSLVEESCQTDDKKASTKELISLFNAITNVTKVTINSNFFPKDGKILFHKESQEKTVLTNGIKAETNENQEIILTEESIKGIVTTSNLLHQDHSIPGPSKITSPKQRRILAKSKSEDESSNISKVTIEELDEYDLDKNENVTSQSSVTKEQPTRPPLITEISSDSKESSPPLNLISKARSESSSGSSINSGSSSSVKIKTSPIQKRLTVWTCTRCTLENARWRLTCEACDMWRPTVCDYSAHKKELEAAQQAKAGSKEPLDSRKSVEVSQPEKKENIQENIPRVIDVSPKPIDKQTSDMIRHGQIVTLSKLRNSTVDGGTSKSPKNSPAFSRKELPSSPNPYQNPELKCSTENKENKFQVPGNRSPEAEEVRKARLAFFDKNQREGYFSKEIQTDNCIETAKKVSVNEKLKLRELLKEMKDSLPKHAKKLNVSKSEPVMEDEEKISNLKSTTAINEEMSANAILNSVPLTKIREEKKHTNLEINDVTKTNFNTNVSSSPLHKDIKLNEKSIPIKNDELTIISCSAEHGIKPGERSIPIKLQESSSTSKSEGNAEAYLVTTETIIEEIKVRPKVSSSAQTSTKVVDSSSKSSGEIVVPITIEEYTTGVDGIKTSNLSRGKLKMDVSKFELMRPKDFALKTEKKDQPTYANSESGTSIPVMSHEDPQPGPSCSVGGGGAEPSAALETASTLALNRLLRRLEVAISGGNHLLASQLAKELAQLKINCSVVRQKHDPTDILMNLYVEDKVSHRGPIHVRVKPWMRLGDLKAKIEREYEIPASVQRWIIDKRLAADVRATLRQLGLHTSNTPVFLYLVAPEVNSSKETEETSQEQLNKPLDVNSFPNKEVTNSSLPNLPEKKSLQVLTPHVEISNDGWKCEACTLVNDLTRPGCAACTRERPKEYVIPENTGEASNQPIQIIEEVEDRLENYKKLVDLEKDELVISSIGFECPVCLTDYSPEDGVVLRECLHTFCRNCLADTVKYSEGAEVKCPFRDTTYTCDSVLLEREIKALVTPEAYEEHLAKSVALAETTIKNAFHCKTADCKGWCIYEDNVNQFKCPVCHKSNCLTCQAIHEGLNCKQYQEQINQNSESNLEAKRTKEMLQEMVDRGEAMNCPTCKVVLMKKWGCDWLRCSMCKTEICWVTRGPRWGPNGKGDVTGGCQCGINGVKCHPKCNYCH